MTKDEDKLKKIKQLVKGQTLELLAEMTPEQVNFVKSYIQLEVKGFKFKRLFKEEDLIALAKRNYNSQMLTG